MKGVVLCFLIAITMSVSAQEVERKIKSYTDNFGDLIVEIYEKNELVEALIGAAAEAYLATLSEGQVKVLVNTITFEPSIKNGATERFGIYDFLDTKYEELIEKFEEEGPQIVKYIYKKYRINLTIESVDTYEEEKVVNAVAYVRRK